MKRFLEDNPLDPDGKSKAPRTCACCDEPFTPEDYIETDTDYLFIRVICKTCEKAGHKLESIPENKLKKWLKAYGPLIRDEE